MKFFFKKFIFKRFKNINAYRVIFNLKIFVESILTYIDGQIYINKILFIGVVIKIK